VTRYLLDTNVYIRAWRNPAVQGVELERFGERHMAMTHLGSVVFHELLRGATSPAMAKDLVGSLARPFIRTRRVVAPSHRAWTRAAEVIAELTWHDGLDRGNLPPGFANDVLIAATCRENGLTLITGNARDFRRIQKRLKFEFVAPWPS
jgi:predicted nucleic acid-binding protein